MSWFSCFKKKKPVREPREPKDLSSKVIPRDASFFWGITATEFPGNYDVYGLDLFDSKAEDIKSLEDKILVAYFSAHYEDWRPDASNFPDTQRALGDWKGEGVVDIRQWDQLKPIYERRISLASKKGFHYIEVDNIDQKVNGVSDQDIVTFAVKLSSLARLHGLKMLQKNLSERVNELEPFMGGVIAESCNVYNECNSYKRYWDNNKPVFMVEYERKHFKGKDFGSTYLNSKNNILDGKNWEMK